MCKPKDHMVQQLFNELTKGLFKHHQFKEQIYSKSHPVEIPLAKNRAFDFTALK